MTQLKNEIVNKLYNSFGTDSGILFGIKERQIVETIVEFTLESTQQDKPISKEEGGYRVGRAQGRAVLNKDGVTIVVFEHGQEDYAQLFCDALNSKNKEEDNIVFVEWVTNNYFPLGNTNIWTDFFPKVGNPNEFTVAELYKIFKEQQSKL